MRYRSLALVAALVLILGCGGRPASAQVSLGGEAAYRFGAQIPIGSPSDTLLSHVGSATASLYAASDVGEIELIGAVEQDFMAGSTDLSLEESELVAYLGSYLVLRTGVFDYQPSVSDLLPSFNFFARRDLESYFEGRVGEATLPAPLVQLTGLAGPYFGRVTIMPTEAKVPFVDPDSPWFPNLGFPEEIRIGFPSPTVMRLTEIVVEPYPDPSRSFTDVSYQAEFGGTVRAFDFRLLYYHGQDLRPRYTATLEFPEGLFQDYRVRLTPIEWNLDAFGASLLAVLGPVRTYGEILHRHTDAVVIERVTSTPSGFQTIIHESPTYTYTLGASYRSSFPAVLLTAEYTNSGILKPVTRMIEPNLEHAAAASATWSPLDGRLSLTAFGLVSLRDYSFNTSFRGEVWSRDASLGLRLTVPAFWGEPDTELGQFSDLLFPSVTLTYRF